jgi:outer membrane protein assembly factor BamB
MDRTAGHSVLNSMRLANGGYVGYLAASAPGWPEFHRDSRLSGDAPSSSLSTKNASRLGVAWATDLYSAALDSPVVAYDPSLGETLAYIGTENGNVLAVNVANGHIVWGTWLGAAIRATPAVANGAVFVGTSRNAALFKLNASTGAVECSAIAPQPIEGSPTIVSFAHRNATVIVGTLDSAVKAGPIIAMDTGNCTIDWTFTAFPHTTGSWDPVASALNVTGVPLVLFGTSDTDSAVYALNAATGAEVWRFQTYNPPPGLFDVGAGATVSPPGALGFTHGVAYVPNKYGIMYALDLSNGTQLWNVSFNHIAGVTGGGRSTAALEAGNLVFGFSTGLFDLNATTGAVLWVYNDTAGAEAISSPAILGPPGRAIAAVADLAGGFDVVSLSTGTQLYHYKTGGYVTGSPAVAGGNVLLASSDGFLYDFAVGGGNDLALPRTTIASPGSGSAIANPNGNVLVAGTASDPNGLGGVMVAVQSNGATGPWWDAATGTWLSGPVAGPASWNGSGNGTTASWTFSYPTPSAGGTYRVTAYAIARSGQSDIRGASSDFSVNFSARGPHMRATATYFAPGASCTIIGGGFGRAQSITVRLAGSIVATGTTSVTGYLPALSFAIPNTAAFGLASLVATAAPSGKSAAAPVIIGNSWEQSGYGATHVAYEPNDPALDRLVYPGGSNWVKLAWHFKAGVAVNGSPAIADGVAYLANTAGELFALDIHNGGLIWSWTDPTGAPINGSPAVDPSAGLVFVTTTHGSVYGVSTSNGTLRWTASVGGALTPPVLGGATLYVGSDNGTVAALVESNGSSTWRVSLPSPVRAAATLDASRNRLFVPEGNGDLVALNSTTGVRNWTYVAGGSILGEVTVYGSRVYLGALDGNVTSLRESTGAKVWSFQTGGPVSAGAALSHSRTPHGSSLELLVGSQDGNLYAIDALNGSLNYKVPVGSPIVGVSSASGVVLFETGTGLIGGARTYSNVTVWDYRAGMALASAPAIVDGTVFVGAEDGYLYAFTPYGQPPV